MTEEHDPPLVPGMIPTTMFDAWFMPFSAWANWCSFCAEALHATQIRPSEPFAEDETPVHVEEEEGLVA